MVKKFHFGPNKCTLTSQVDKTLDQSLSQKNIKSGFKVIGIQLLNPKVIDHKTKPYELYIPTPTNISYENNDGFDDTINRHLNNGEKMEVLQN